MLRLLFIIIGCVALSTSALAQNRITGKVSSANTDEGIPGVNIFIKGTAKGTATDIDGNYSLTIPEGGAQLEFTAVGMKPVSKFVESGVVNIQMEPDSKDIDEIIVVGYGTQTRSRMTTSVSKLNSKNLESMPRANAASALQGTIAGLSVSHNTGQPGATPTMVLRGGTSWSGDGAPLVLIDGVESSFYALNPEDIASIEVLKDAASTAIYGARSANGVVLITTKHGKAGQSSINYSYKFGINERRKGYDYLNAHDYIYYNRLAVKNYTEVTGRHNFDAGYLNGRSGGFGTGNNTTNSPFTTQILTDANKYLLSQPGWNKMPDPINPAQTLIYMDNNMSELFYQNSTVNDHYLSFDGGNDKGTYSLGLGYMNNDGIILGSGFERYSGKLNASYKVKRNVKISTSLLYSHSSINYNAFAQTDYTIFQRSAGQPPTSRIYNNNPDGTLSDVPNQGTNHSFGNPLYYKDKFIRNNLEQRLTAGVSLDWNIIDNLKLTLKGSYFIINDTKDGFNKAFYNGGSLNTTRTSYVNNKRENKNQFTAFLDYQKTFFQKHNLNAMIGVEYFHRNIFTNNSSAKNSPTDLIYTMNSGSEADGIPSSFYTENKIISTFGRLVYDFDMKYLFSFTFRYDGSSKLGNNKYGFFPGISLGWNMHNEEFYKNWGISHILSKIKPRLSYGVNGNINVRGLSDFGVYGTYGNIGVYNGQTGYANTGLPTLDLTWERSTTFDIGLDLGLWNNRVTILTDYFVRDVKDKIANLTLPYWTGFGSIFTNNGTLRNKGFEMEVKAQVINSEGFTLDLSATFYTIKNYVVKLPDNDNENNRQGGIQVYNPETGKVEWVAGLQEGMRVGNDEVWAYEQIDLYRTQADLDKHKNRYDAIATNKKNRFLGDVIWNDRDQNDTIDYRDRVFIGRTVPNIMGAFTLNANYKGFNIFVKTDYALGHVIKNYQREKGLAQTQGSLNSTVDVLDTWSPKNTDAKYARYVFVDPQKNHIRNNSVYWEKGDYICIREVTLSYNFGKTLFHKYINSLRLYITASNLKYFKAYSGVAPEKGGTDIGRYQLPRTYTFGLNISF